MKKNNYKWILIAILSSFIIIFNGLQYFQNNKTKDQKGKFMVVNYDKYYDKTIPEINLELDNKIVNLSDKRNRLIIGLDSDDYAVHTFLNSIQYKIDFKEVDLEMLFVTKAETKEISEIIIEKFRSIEFEIFFDLFDTNYFIILIQKDSRIKYYNKYLLPNPEDIKTLMRRYSKHEDLN